MSQTLKSTAANQHASGSIKQLLRNASIAIGGAAVVNTVLGNVANAAGVDMAVKGFGAVTRESLPVFSYFVSTVIGGLLGIALTLLMKRFGTKKKVFIAVAAALTVASLISPLLSDMTSGTKVVLEAMHLLAAAAIIPALARSLRD